MKKNIPKLLLAIKSAKIAQISKSWGVLESLKPHLFEFVKKKLEFAILIF